MAAVDVRQLTVHYGKSVALWDINLEIPAGVMCGIVGPNGAGKSTLLKALLGLVKPASGEIFLLGESIDRARRRVAFVPQRTEIDWTFPVTALDVVLMGSYGRVGWIRRPGVLDRKRAMEALEMVGMAEFSRRQIQQLSGGQQQRLFLARALLQDADIYFLDEPFAGIDMATEKVVIELLGQLRNQGKSLFVVHHDLNTVKSYFDWLVLLNMRLIGAGPVDEIFDAAHVQQAYGSCHLLFEEVVKRSHEVASGEEA